MIVFSEVSLLDRKKEKWGIAARPSGVVFDPNQKKGKMEKE